MRPRPISATTWGRFPPTGQLVASPMPVMPASVSTSTTMNLRGMRASAA